MLPPLRDSSTRADQLAGTLLDQVIASGVPRNNVDPAAGLVMATAGWNSLKLLLTAVTVSKPLMVRVTRRRASSALGPGTDPLKLPVFGIEATMVSNVAPPSRLSSTLTVPTFPALLVQEAETEFV